LTFSDVLSACERQLWLLEMLAVGRMKRRKVSLERTGTLYTTPVLPKSPETLVELMLTSHSILPTLCTHQKCFMIHDSNRYVMT
jgi:hypothetical protein